MMKIKNEIHEINIKIARIETELKLHRNLIFIILVGILSLIVKAFLL